MEISTEPKKILIIQTAFLGDLILTTPFIAAVAKEHPNSMIHIVVNQGTQDVLSDNPDLDKIIPLDKKKAQGNLLYFLKFARDLKKEKYDLVYSPHFSFRSSILSWWTRAKIRIGYKESGFSFLHTKSISRPRLGPHEVDKLFSLLYDKPEDFPKGRERRPFLYPKKELLSSAMDKLDPKIRQNYIVVAPSSLWETKRYSEEGFAEFIRILLRETHYSIVLTGSPADSPLNSSILEILGETKGRVVDLAGKTKLSELGAIISMAKAIITNDSSPVHYASAFNIPTVLIYGATIPAFGYYGLSESLAIAQVDGLSCRPCGIHGGRVCPEKHFRCMKDQSPESIFQKFQEIMKV